MRLAVYDAEGHRRGIYRSNAHEEPDRRLFRRVQHGKICSVAVPQEGYRAFTSDELALPNNVDDFTARRDYEDRGRDGRAWPVRDMTNNDGLGARRGKKIRASEYRRFSPGSAVTGQLSFLSGEYLSSSWTVHPHLSSGENGDRDDRCRRPSAG